jgi:hypothetical protein
VPPGGYKYTAWRAGGPLVNGTIQVTPNGAMLEVDWR